MTQTFLIDLNVSHVLYNTKISSSKRLEQPTAELSTKAEWSGADFTVIVLVAWSVDARMGT